MPNPLFLLFNRTKKYLLTCQNDILAGILHQTGINQLSLLDDRKALSVCEYRNKDQEYNTLYELHGLGREAHHYESV